MNTIRPSVGFARTTCTALAVSGALLAGCSGAPGADPSSPSSPGATGAPATVMVETPPPGQAGSPSSLVTASAPAAAPAEPAVVLKDVGFKTPESALHDPEADVYLVSNINGSPTEANGAGFISKVSPEGKVLELKWIEGKKKGVTLNAPKGLALHGAYLYVADLTFVRIFDRKTGAPRGKIAAGGATFLNDVSVAPDGTIYVSDSGLKEGKEGFEPTGSDAIYKIGKAGRADKLVANPELGRPNGLLADDQGVWVSTFGSGAVYRVGLDGKHAPEQKLPVGSLDGIVGLPDGSILVSSWAGSQVLRGTPGGTFQSFISGVKAPADIGFDAKRGVVLVPLFTEDSLHLVKLPGGAPAAAPAAAAPAPAAPTGPVGPAGKAAAPAAPPAAPAAKAGPPAAAPSSPPNPPKPQPASPTTGSPVAGAAPAKPAAPASPAPMAPAKPAAGAPTPAGTPPKP